MARIDDFCIDKYEAHVITGGGSIHPQNIPPKINHFLSAESSACVLPQTHMTYTGAEMACENAGKRLCKHEEFLRACQGADYTGPRGPCNIGKSPPGMTFIMKLLYPTVSSRNLTGAMFNDPRLGLLGNGLNIPDKAGDLGSLEDWKNGGSRLSDTREWYPLKMRYLVKTGEYTGCVTFGAVYDLLGNADEYVKKDHGDAGVAETINGEGRPFVTLAGGHFGSGDKSTCNIVTDGHSDLYKDYSTGFRCCADARGSAKPSSSAKPPSSAR